MPVSLCFKHARAGLDRNVCAFHAGGVPKPTTQVPPSSEECKTAKSFADLLVWFGLVWVLSPGSKQDNTTRIVTRESRGRSRGILFFFSFFFFLGTMRQIVWFSRTGEHDVVLLVLPTLTLTPTSTSNSSVVRETKVTTSGHHSSILFLLR